MKLSIILPMLNEGQIIERTITEVEKKVAPHVETFEIIAINDGSKDNTQEILEKLQKKYRNIVIVEHKKNKGYGAALQKGAKIAKYDWIFFMDSDLQFDIREIKKFIPFTTSYDFVIGYRKDRADNMKRILISKAYNMLVSKLFDIHLIDIDCAFKLMRKPSVLELGKLPTSFFVSTTLLVKALRSGIRLKELPVRHLPRTKGVSTVTLPQVFRTLKDLALIYFELNIQPTLGKAQEFASAFSK